MADNTLLKEVFNKMDNLKSTYTREQEQERINRIYALTGSKFSLEDCTRAFNLLNTLYSVSPERSKEMLSKRAGVIFQNQLSDAETDMIINLVIFGIEEVSEEKDFLAAQAKAYSGMAENTVSCDELEDSDGRFGYDLGNPIPVNGIDRIDDYLTRLKVLTGESITYNRLGSNYSEKLPYPVDKYAIFNSDKEKITELYIYAYHGNMSQKAPEGFKLII